MDREITFFYEAAVPDPSQDLVLGNDFAGILDEELQYVEGLCCQLEVIVVPDNGTFQGVQQTVSEFINVHGKSGLFLASVLLILNVE